MDRRTLLMAAGAIGVGSAFPALAKRPDLTLEEVVRDAWIYALPLMEMANTRARHLAQGMKQNRFTHTRRLSDETSRGVTTPNNDTLYSLAWIDLTQGPLTLTVPALGERYWSIGMMDMYSNNCAVPGSRTIGGDGGVFTVVGPGQPGDGPGILRMATPHGWLLIRTLTDGPADLEAAHAAQNGFLLEGPAGTPPALVGADRNSGWAEYFRAAQALVFSDPPPAVDAAAFNDFARAGLGMGAPGRGFDPSTVLDTEAATFALGVEMGRKGVLKAVGGQNFVGGWAYPRANLGDYGQDYGYRAVVALSGLAALPPAEAMYMRAAGDGQGVFNGDGPYSLTLPADLPLDGFWSLSMYEVTPEAQLFFTKNSLNRFAIGDRSPGLKRNADGSVTLWIGRADPGGARSANWLPAPATGPWALYMRAYLPRPQMLDGRWRLPAVVKR